MVDTTETAEGSAQDAGGLHIAHAAEGAAGARRADAGFSARAVHVQPPVFGDEIFRFLRRGPARVGKGFGAQGEKPRAANS